jgi:hypothetical protein
MDFIWNDGGRAACGFVGFTGDCVTRSIAIATGASYRDVYDQLGAASNKSPRNGIYTHVANAYLVERNWKASSGINKPFDPHALPKGVVIVHLAKRSDRCQHFTTVIDGVVHDTWNPSAGSDYFVKAYWTNSNAPDGNSLPAVGPKRQIDAQQELTQSEFEKILSRLRALDRTASNGASTEGEKHNALRMMQSLMLRHNLSREDIVDDDNVEHVRFTRIACPVNGRRACSWEKGLAVYVTAHICPTTQWYISATGHRTLFWFYGPLEDVQNAVSLFRELLLTIATSAKLQFGGHTRGSGASYAEGYVQGLPRWSTDEQPNSDRSTANHALIQSRTLSVHSAAVDWLNTECDLRLITTRYSGRCQHDEAAEKRGKRDGATQKVNVPKAPLRITQQ